MADPQFIRSFKDADGKTYDIPSDEANDFVKEFPKAQEIHSFVVGKDTLDIPKEEVADFVKDIPEAKPLQNYDLGQPVPVQPKPLIAEPETGKDTKPDHGYLMSNILQGITSTEKWIYDLPKLLYKTAALPFEGLANVTGFEALRPPSTEQINKGYEKIPGVGNISKMLGDYSDYLQNNIEADPDAKKNVIDTFTNGIRNGDIKEIGTGFKLLGGQLLQSLPSTILAGAAGMKAVDTGLKMTPYLKELAKSYAPLTAVFAEGKLDEIEKNAPDLPNAEKLTIAWANGFFENLFERELGAGAVAQSLAGIIKNAGKEEGAKIVKQGFKKTFAEMLTDKPWMAPFGEMFEEMGTQISENAFDKYFGYRPEMSLMDGVATAGLAGLTMGGAFGGVISGTKYGVEKVNQAAYNKRKSDLINQAGTHIDENVIPLIKHDTSDQIIEVNHKGKGWFVVSGDVNDPSSMLILANKENPQERITPSRAEIDTKDILYIPTSEFRDSQLQDLKDQFAEIEAKKKQKVQQEDHAASFTLNDPVTMPDGRTGKIIRIEGRDQFFVVPDENEGREVNPMLFSPAELTKIQPPTDQSTIEPVTDQQNEQPSNTNPVETKPKEQLINIGTQAEPQNTRLITDPDGIKRVDAKFDDQASANKAAEIIRTKGKVSANYDVTVDRVELNPDDEFTDVIYTVTLRPKVAVSSQISPNSEQIGNNLESKVSETAVTPTVEVTQEQAPKTSTPVEPENGNILNSQIANVSENVNNNLIQTENVSEIKPQETNIETITETIPTESLQKSSTQKVKKEKSAPKIQTEAYNTETHPRDVRAIVLKHFIGGGKINKSALQELFGKKNSTNRDAAVEAERKPRFTWVSDSEGSSIAQIAHSLWEEHGLDSEGNTIEGMSDQDFRNEIEDVIKSYSSPVQMAKDLLSVNKAKESQYTDEQILEMEKLGITNEPLSEEDAIFVNSAPQDDAEYINALNEYYGLSAEDQTALNNLYHESYTGTENGVSQSSPKPESNGTSQAENRPVSPEREKIESEITQVKSDLKKAKSLATKASSLYNKLKKSPEFGGKGQISQDGTVAGSEAIDFGNDAILNGAKKKVTEANQAVSELEKKHAKLEDSLVNVVHNQQELFVSPLTDLIDQSKKKSNTVDSQLKGQDINLNPTEGQKEAGNYAKGHVVVRGMNITIENPIGSVRKGIDEDGKAWEHTMKSHYGYFKQTEGKDGDHIDTFIGPNPESEKVFVADQINPSTGNFDESKVMIGYNTVEEAHQAYSENYDKDWNGLKSITEVGIVPFKEWLNDGKKQHKPFAEYKETPDPTIIVPLNTQPNESEKVQAEGGKTAKEEVKSEQPSVETVKKPSLETEAVSVSPLESLIATSQKKTSVKVTSQAAKVFEPGTKVNTKFLGQPLRATVLDSPRISEGKLKVKSSDGVIYTVKVSDTSVAESRYSMLDDMISPFLDLVQGKQSQKAIARAILSISKTKQKILFLNKEDAANNMVQNGVSPADAKETRIKNYQAVQIKGRIYIKPEITDPREVGRLIIHELIHGKIESQFPNLLDRKAYCEDIYLALGKNEIESVVPEGYWSDPIRIQGEEYFSHKVEQIIERLLFSPQKSAEQIFDEILSTVPDNSIKNAILETVNQTIELNKLRDVINTHITGNSVSKQKRSITKGETVSNRLSEPRHSVDPRSGGTSEQGLRYGGKRTPIQQVTHAYDILNPGDKTVSEGTKKIGNKKEKPANNWISQRQEVPEMGQVHGNPVHEGENGRRNGNSIPKESKKSAPPAIKIDGVDQPTHALDILNGTAMFSRDAKPLTVEEKRAQQKAEITEIEWVKTAGERLRRGMQDAELSAKLMQEFIEKATGEKLPSHMDGYKSQNLESSKNAYAIKQLEETIVKPLVRAQLDLKNNYKVSDEEIADYVMASHAPERNLTERAKRVNADYSKVENSVGTTEQVVNLMDDLKAQNKYKEQVTNMSADEFRAWYLEKKKAQLEKKYAENDYAGLTEWMNEEVDKGLYHPSNREESREKWSVDEFANFKIKQFEDKVTDKKHLKELWHQVNRLTKFSLDEDLRSGRINQQMYDFLLNRWKKYVPLRGFENITAGDVFDYTTGETNGMIQPMKRIEGRRSKADDPFANMVSMAQSSIIQGNKNRTALSALYMVRAYPQFQAKNDKASGLFRLAKTVLRKDTVTGSWFEYDENDGVVPQEDFDKGLAKRVSDPSSFLLRRTNLQDKESQVVAVEDGVRKVMYFADPDVARSYKGINKESTEKVVKAYTAVIGKPTRIITRLWTTYSPKFILSNTPVDLLFSEFNHMINSNGNFIGFNQALPGSAKVLSKYVWGGRESLKPEYDSNGVPTNMDGFMVEFLENGAETGFSHQMSIAQHRIAINKLQKELSGDALYAPKKVLDVVIDQIQHTAELSEGLSRLSTYVASRKSGKTKQQSAFDAHEITVNFTKSGKYTSVFSPLYGFFNVGFQSLKTGATLINQNKGKGIAALAALVALGYATAAVLSATGPEDDKDKSLYYSLSDYDRFNKFIIRNGKGFIVITVPHFFRAFYALGVGIHDITSGHKNMMDGVLDVSGNMLSTLSPINMQGSGFTKDGASARFVVPTALQPVLDLKTNSDAFGSKVYKEPFLPAMNGVDPAYTMSMPYVNPTLKEASRKWNNLWGGDDNRSMEMVVNPKTQEWEHNKLKGMIDWNPSQVEHVFEYMGGGAARSFNELAKTVNYLIDKSNGKDVPLEPRSTPVLSTFYREPKSVNDISKSYNLLKSRMQTQDFMTAKAKEEMITNKNSSPFIKEMSNIYTRRRMAAYDIAEKQLDALNKSFKYDPSMKNAEMMDRVNQIKKTAVDEVLKIDKNLEELYKTGSNEDTRNKSSADNLLKYLHK